MSLLDDSEKLRKAIIDSLAGMTDLDAKIYSRIVQLMDEYDSKGGKFENSKSSKAKLLYIREEIEKILKQSGYFKAANTFISDLRKITDNTIALQSGINKIDIQKKSLTGIESVYRQQVVQSLNESGLNYTFIEPVTNALNEAITFGNSIEATRESLKTFILGDSEGKAGKLSSYLTVTARDAVSRLQGAQQQAILNEYKMPYIRYFGNIIKGTSGQCYKWRTMEYLPIKELPDLIEEAKKNQKIKLDMPKGHKWSGFDVNTTPENFLIKRGHIGCIHNAVPVRFRS